MTSHEITCADGVSVTITLASDETPVHSTLNRLQEVFGATPDEVFQEILQDFNSHTVAFEIEPGSLGGMVLAFEAGLLYAGKLMDGAKH